MIRSVAHVSGEIKTELAESDNNFPSPEQISISSNPTEKPKLNLTRKIRK